MPWLAQLRFGNQNTLLHIAAQTGQIKPLKLLLRTDGCDSIRVNLFQQTPFQLAYEEGFTYCCEVLRERSQQETECFISTTLQQTYCDDNACFKQVYVHIDLKGAPPKFDFLERLIKFIATNFRHLVTGLLIEFEDMFPFTGVLQLIRSPNCYSEE